MSLATTMSMPMAPVRHRACVYCARALGHCHGTLVLHVDGTIECTDPRCQELDFALHELVIECVQVSSGCACDAGH